MKTAEFVNTPISDVLRVVSDLTGWSIILSPGVTQLNPKVNLWIKDMSPRDVLDQVVKLSGLVLNQTDTNTYQIMTFDEYARLFGVNRQVRQLTHVSAEQLVKILQPFIEGQKADKIIAAMGNKVVLLVPQPLLGQLDHLIDAIDVPFKTGELQIVKLTYLDAATIVPMLDPFLTKSIGQGGHGADLFAKTVPPADATQTKTGEVADKGENNKAGAGLLVQFMVVPKLNVVVVRGLPLDVKRAVDLLKNLDQPAGLTVVSYQLNYTNASGVREVLDNLLDQENRLGGGATDHQQPQQSRLRVAVSEQNNRVVVVGSPQDQKRIAEIIRAIDQPLPAGAGAIRVYRLENSTADEVATILQDMLNKQTNQNSNTSAQAGGPGKANVNTGVGQALSGPSAARSPISLSNGQLGTSLPPLSVNELPPRVTAAKQINAVIVRASAAEQEAIAQVIAELDKPRDQVLIKVTLVTVTATNQFNLGVEVSGKAHISGTDLLGFSTFGIGTVNSTTGMVNVNGTAPFGANIGVMNHDDLSLVLNALRTVGHVKISSVPKILAEDNSPAKISQVTEEPYETTSQGDTSTLTGFGGFVKAGTTLTVTPHVSHGDWLRLKYEVDLSSFNTRTAEQLAENLPPPRVSNTSEGVVRIPSGRIVVLGGLTSSRNSHTVDEVPLLADIPIVGELFKNRTQDDKNDTLFIFIQPVVLHDTHFQDLLLLSKDDIREAGIKDQEFPTNPMQFFGASAKPLEEVAP